MRRPEESQLRELMFRVSEFLKGFDGALETVGGIALWVVSPGLIVRAVGLLTQGEIAEDPHDIVANYLRHASGHFSLLREHFMATYLLGHGFVKIFVVVALLRNKLWAYPCHQRLRGICCVSGLPLCLNLQCRHDRAHCDRPHCDLVYMAGISGRKVA